MSIIQTEALVMEGTLNFDQLVAGVYHGEQTLNGIAELTISNKSKLVEQISKDKGKYGQVVASVAIPEPAELSIKLTGMSPRALAMALQGTYSSYSQGSGTVTDQAVTAKLGTWVDLGKRNIGSTSVVVTNSGANVTYVEGTDYEVNYAVGKLYFPTTSTIADAQSLKVDYTYAAIAGTKVLGNTLSSVRGRLFLDGRNLADGKPATLEIWDATLTTDGNIDFMADKPVELSLKGRMATPTGKSSPYELIYDQVYS